jgi:hypothetical protein
VKLLILAMLITFSIVGCVGLFLTHLLFSNNLHTIKALMLEGNAQGIIFLYFYVLYCKYNTLRVSFQHQSFYCMKVI